MTTDDPGIGARTESESMEVQPCEKCGSRHASVESTQHGWLCDACDPGRTTGSGGGWRPNLYNWWPTMILIPLWLVSLNGPGGVEPLILVGLVGLQILVLGFKSVLWGKRVVESAAGVDE